MVIGLIGAFLFVIIQMILLIDFAHGWSESWVEKYEETEAKCYYYGENSLLVPGLEVMKFFSCSAQL